MNSITLDFETYFDDQYTLHKLTTEAYVRDPRFKAHCIGVKGPGGATVLNHFGHKTLENMQGCGIIAHHAHFDGLILAHHYGIRPAFWLDTLSMARLVFPHAKSHSLESLAELLGIGKKDVPYESFKGVRDLPPDLYQRVAAGCANDVELTHAIAMKLLPYVPKDELRIIDMTVRLFTEPSLVLDRPRMEWYAEALKQKKADLLTQLGVTAKELGSNDKYAEILRRLGIEPETKEGKKGPIFAFAKTDDFMRGLLEHPDDNVALLAEARIETKSTGTLTRAQRLLGMDARGALPVYINYAGAHTLRDSGGDKVNWQNFKRIDFDADGKPVEGVEQRGAIRLAIKAPPGYYLVVVDSSQIECRLLNWMAGQQDVLDKFAAKIDIYSQLASRFYGFEVTKANKAERGTGKQLELSCGYGAGAETIVETAKLGIYGPPVTLTLEQGKMARDLYRSTHPHVKQLWQYATGALECLVTGGHDFMWGPLRVYDKRIYGPGGTWLDYTNLGWSANDKQFYVKTRKGVRKIYGAALVENVIQYLGRLVLMEAALKISEKYKIVLRTHDELAYPAKIDEAPEALAWGLQIMKTPPAWCAGIPLDAEGGYDERYSK